MRWFWRNRTSENFKNLENSLEICLEKISTLFSHLEEIAAFANDAKNGLFYHSGQDVILTAIFTGQIIAVDRRDVSLAPHLIINGMWEE